jgi:uncharacterized protein YxeA
MEKVNEIKYAIQTELLLFLNSRYKKTRISFEHNLVGISYEIPRPESSPKEYEVQVSFFKYLIFQEYIKIKYNKYIRV